MTMEILQKTTHDQSVEDEVGQKEDEGEKGNDEEDDEDDEEEANGGQCQ